MRRSKRPEPRVRDAGTGSQQPVNAPTSPAPAGSAPAHPSDGDHNQGGARPEGLDYQRDLGIDQDA
ncbi:hypothetical protein WS67_22495 [Burkholderia singularis]|uniref:Uncharacterized protein n=1 Tax=Burkholderia singularis TaxID=1503053 RepID=A0A103DVE7_9BURK|nr:MULTISPECIES: hypothetical protein [Burkholderia]AOK30311.1 hypothetical protein AQ611_13570 [Burkholderia sp. Bp7605]KVE23463.1 hypothetical protein WS67_22495 [Burkholderia singularis]